jgi:hypothetical protein
VLAEDAVVWLPPFEIGTVIALGLNYADHVKELSKELTVTSKDEPLVFLKTPGAVIGHRGYTRRPGEPSCFDATRDATACVQPCGSSGTRCGDDATTADQGRWLRSVVTGYFAYHAVPTNAHELGA